MERALPLRARLGRPLPVAVLGTAIVALDQATKFVVRANLDVGESFPDWPVRFTRVNNTGSAFGLFTDQTLFLIIASVFAIGIVVYFYRQLVGTSISRAPARCSAPASGSHSAAPSATSPTGYAMDG